LSALFTSFHEKKNRENHVIFGSLDENLPLTNLKKIILLVIISYYII